jgi:isopentenyl diphosphate isomerase/L-lactate dehydrogenase-like FMN-dependent dehydrogenase
MVCDAARLLPWRNQLYTPTDRELAASLVSRAEAAGFRGVVVTLDPCLPVIFDSGIRSGADVIKALALVCYARREESYVGRRLS